MKSNGEDAIRVKTNITSFSVDYVYSLITDTLFFKAIIFRDQNYGSGSVITKECVICSQFFFSMPVNRNLSPAIHVAGTKIRGLTPYQAGATHLILFSLLQCNILSCLQGPLEFRFQCKKKKKKAHCHCIKSSSIKKIYSHSDTSE